MAERTFPLPSNPLRYHAACLRICNKPTRSPLSSRTIYEITCASTRRAYQLAKIQEPNAEKSGDKVVSAGAKQIFTGEVNYQVERHPEFN